MEFDETTGRVFLQLPDGYALPEPDDLVHDARAVLLHMVNLRRDALESGVQVSPIWEDLDGQAALRAMVVPKPVEARHFEGRGMAALKDPNALTLIADAASILAEQPGAAAQVLARTASLYIHEEAPVRPLGLPYKGHYKLLTLVIADFLRKFGSGFDDTEWLGSIGVLEAFHDPAVDPPVAEVNARVADKTQRMVADEAAWEAAFGGSDG